MLKSAIEVHKVCRVCR